MYFQQLALGIIASLNLQSSGSSVPKRKDVAKAQVRNYSNYFFPNNLEGATLFYLKHERGR